MAASPVKKKIYRNLLLVLAVMIVGGIGALLLERVVLPQVSGWPILRNFDLLDPATPITITRREEIRINEGINNQDVVNRVKGAQVKIYNSGVAFGGVLVTRDGLILSPLDSLNTLSAPRVVFPDNQIFSGRVLATDAFSGLAFIKIDAGNLPVINQTPSREKVPSEKLLAIWPTEKPLEMAAQIAELVNRSAVAPSSSRIYELSRLNSYLTLNIALTPEKLGAVIADSNANMVGFVTQIGKDMAVLRSEDLELVINNFLDDQKIVWPNNKISYMVWAETQTKIAGLQKTYGILIKQGLGALRENDFVFALDGRELGNEEFQKLLLGKKPGDTVKLKVLRNNKEIDIDITL